MKSAAEPRDPRPAVSERTWMRRCTSHRLVDNAVAGHRVLASAVVMQRVCDAAPCAPPAYLAFHVALLGIDLPATTTSMMDGPSTLADAHDMASPSSPYVRTFHPWQPNTSDSLL